MNEDDGLDRFVAAQAAVWPAVRAELAAARKTSHWMWFVFPQWRGLGASAMAQRYGIASRTEALAYLAHPLLGERLREATALVLAAPPQRTLHAARCTLHAARCTRSSAARTTSSSARR